MTANEFRDARTRLGHTSASLAREWGMGANGARNIRRWESGQKEIPGPVAYRLRLMLAQD